MKKYIQRGLCELSEIAKTFSTVYVKVFRLFIYLIVWKHESSGRIARQVARVYWESLCGFNSQCVNIVDNLSFLDKYKSWHEAVSDPKATCCKNGLNADIFFRVLEKRGKIVSYSWPTREKPVVTIDWRPPKGRLELKEKPFEGAC